jgi:hypothetical protein
MPKPDEITTPEPSPGKTRADPAGAPSRPAVTPVPGPGTPASRAPTRPTTTDSVPARAPRHGAVTVGNGRPGSARELRRDIEQTRARMSDTLDALETRIADERRSLERKKDDLVDRVTLKPVREKLSREPWRSMALAFVAGYIVAAIRD